MSPETAINLLAKATLIFAFYGFFGPSRSTRYFPSRKAMTACAMLGTAAMLYLMLNV